VSAFDVSVEDAVDAVNFAEENDITIEDV